MDFVEVLMSFGEGRGFLVAIHTFSAAVLLLNLTLTNYLKKKLIQRMIDQNNSLATTF